MRSLRQIVVAIAAAAAGGVASCAYAGATHLTVFRSGEEGYPVYRIPTIVRAANDDLLAIVEARDSLSDTGDIDLVLKRSTDNGATWGPLQLILDNGTLSVGNPAPVLDVSTGRLQMLFSIEQNNVRVITSDDHGATWSPPRNIHSDVSGAGWTWHVPGPVHGIQLERGPHAGRLVIPSDHINAGKWGAHVVYSDDHGATWRLGANYEEALDGQIKVNENVAVELTDGRLYFNSRDHGSAAGTRSVGYSSDGGESYDGPFVAAPNFSGPTVQNSVIRFSAIDAGDDENTLIYSGPGHPTNRRDLTIRVSHDEGGAWADETVLRSGPAAYSDLVKLDDQRVGVLFETGATLYDEIAFSQFAVADLAPPPWNGVDGDVDQNGALEPADVTEFVAQWTTATNVSYFGGQDNYTHGDLNFDGRNDLLDVFKMRTSLIAAGLPFSGLQAILGVPEPDAIALLAPALLCRMLRAGCQSTASLQGQGLSRLAGQSR